ncbi:hypothetical protein [Pontibacter flavimaris]|uniref:hypothetical protein n=1 Tax=Pontibacter flavimaris TaxID=1797110 RepID=UPI00111536F1|nr:hypothetical protein [Pontibacter flavimaris]
MLRLLCPAVPDILVRNPSAADILVRDGYTLYFLWRKLKVPEHFGASACAFLYFSHTFYT